MDIIRKNEKIFISPITNLDTKKRKKTWPKVFLVLLIILFFTGITTFGGCYAYNYFKYKDFDGLTKYVPSTAKTYIYINKDKILHDNLKANGSLLNNAKVLKVMPINEITAFGNENALAFDDNSILIISKDPNYDLFNKNLETAKLSFFDYKNDKIYNAKSATNDFYYSQIDNCLAISNNVDTIRATIDTAKNPNKSIRADKYFSQINKKTLAGAFVYTFSKQPNEFVTSLLGSNAKILQNANLNLGNFFAFEASDDSNNISFKLYTDGNLDKKLSFKDDFRYLPVNSLMAYSANNLPEIYNSLKQDSTSNNNADFLKNIDASLKANYNLDLNKDVLSIFNNNFEIVVFPKKKSEMNFGVVASISDEDEMRIKLQNIETGLIQYYAQKKPKEKKVTLADGSEGIELVPDVTKFEFKNLDFQNFKIRRLVEKTDNKKTQNDIFAYSLQGDKLFLASSSDNLKSMLLASQNSTAKIDDQVKANNGLLYLNSLDLLNNFGLNLKGDLTMGFQDGNSVNGIIRLF